MRRGRAWVQAAWEVARDGTLRAWTLPAADKDTDGESMCSDTTLDVVRAALWNEHTERCSDAGPHGQTAALRHPKKRTLPNQV